MIGAKMMKNIKPSVLILTAGRGSRLNDYSMHLNKALLPLGKKAIISRIIEKFSEDSRFVIAVGHRSEQVKTYLSMAHPNTCFMFVDVDNYDGPGSGPGYSTMCCKNHLQEPFFYVSCDTLWHENVILPTDSNWLGSAAVASEESSAYLNLELTPELDVIGLHDKVKVEGDNFQAFIGLAFIKDYATFWESLRTSELIRGENQVSNGLKALVRDRSVKALPLEWIDTGDAQKYEKAVAMYEQYDFSKADEALYISEDRVIKFFSNPTFAITRVKRARANPAVFPVVSDAVNGFYSYPFISGQTLYQHCSDEIFEKLLDWLPRCLWKNVKVDADEFKTACDFFYRIKTEERLNKYFQKYPSGMNIKKANGLELQPIQETLNSIPWDRICCGNPSFFHGDFHFDHIIYDADRNSFKLLDWRQDFGGFTDFGDTYYDLAKFCGGLRLNYDYIKDGRFTYSESGDEVFFTFDRRPEGDLYETRFHKFIEDQGYSLEIVKLIIPIIFLNMAPLHHYPFDKMLFALGSLTLQNEVR
jgi:NDP-sugar pyrophosphorylase family protein